MGQKQIMSAGITHSERKRPRKRIRRRRRLHIRVITTFICFLTGVFCAYALTSNNKRISLPHNALAGYPIASDFDRLTLVPDEISVDNHSFANRSIPSRFSSSYPINSANAVLMEFEDGSVVFDQNGAAKMYPASMTKIMTAIVTLEHIEDLNVKVLLNEAVFQPIYHANASVAGFLPGESVRVIDLLYGLLLPSGAECAVGLAEYVAGSESSFVDLMNDKAREIGMNGSHFTNVTGLHDDNHYSTAMDMAILFRYALANDMFYEMVTCVRYSTPATNRHDSGITFYSTLFSKMSNRSFDGGAILGGKTGYTEEAGQCLASLAVKDGGQYILVTSGAAGGKQKQDLHIDDALTIYASIGE